MGTCSLNVKIPESFDNGTKKDPFSTLGAKSVSHSQGVTNWKIVSPVQKSQELVDSWLTRENTPASDSTNNKNCPDTEIKFLVKADNVMIPKTKAYLISVNQMESVNKIYWTKSWGYIVFDTNLSPTIHGKTNTSIGLKLSKISSSCGSDIKVGENEFGDLVIFTTIGKNNQCV